MVDLKVGLFSYNTLGHLVNRITSIMLWKLVLSLATLYSHQSHSPAQESSIPSEHGPRCIVDETEARNALHGKYYGGDIIFPKMWNTSDNGIQDTQFRWPGYPGAAVIPYVIDQSAREFKNVILEGMEQYHSHTCIRFVLKTDQRDYIRIFKGNGCWSVLGRNGRQQDLSLGQGCQHVGIVIHELGHAIGLLHEHQRSDRDNYITVYKNNLVKNQRQHLNLNNPDQELINTPYDYDSIMHYGHYAFSKNPNELTTMEAKNGHRLVEPYCKNKFSQIDLVAIKKLYQC